MDKSKVIAYVDDNEGLRMAMPILIKSLLERIYKIKNEVIPYDDGSSFLEYIFSTKNLPDVLVIDGEMPMMGGLETLAVLASEKSLKSVPAIVYSSNKEILQEAMDRNEELKVHAVIEKNPGNKRVYEEMAEHIVSILNKQS